MVSVTYSEETKSAIAKIIDNVILREGGYVDNPADSGGKTMYGITEKLARKHGFESPMHDLSRQWAIAIYTKEFWSVWLTPILEISPRIAAEVFDTSVNCGPKTAYKFLQRSLNVLNRGETDYDNLKVDGIIGQKTVLAVSAYFEARKMTGEKALLTALNGLQTAYYIGLCEKRPKDETFIYGWLNHRILL